MNRKIWKHLTEDLTQSPLNDILVSKPKTIRSPVYIIITVVINYMNMTILAISSTKLDIG